MAQVSDSTLYQPCRGSKHLLLFKSLFVATLLLTSVMPVHAEFIVNADAFGNYSRNGYSGVIGLQTDRFDTLFSDNPSLGESRSFFIFDLTNISTPISSASFTVYTYDVSASNQYGPNANSAWFGLWDINQVSISTLQNFWDPNLSFQDAGTGSSLGGISLSNADDNNYVTFSLNMNGLTYLNSHLGERVAFGATFWPVSNNGATIDTYSAFYGSQTNAHPVQLILNAGDNSSGIIGLPEPTSLSLTGVGVILVLGFFTLRRRRQSLSKLVVIG